MSDNSARGSWGSWNVVGSTSSPGPLGPTCYSGEKSYCYSSCNNCDDAGCSWTTCENDINPSGFGKELANGFLPALYDLMETNFCIDTAKEYSTGMSNGGMASFQSGATMSTRLAAIVPVAGSMHVGYTQSPSRCLPVMDLHGSRDTVVPANNTRGGGWYYAQVDTNLKAFANSCSQCSSSATRQWKTSRDGQSSLYCVAYGCDEVVRCSWNGGHTWPSYNGDLVWEFLSQFDNEDHIGFGRVKGDTNLTQTIEGLTGVTTLPVNTVIDTTDVHHFQVIKKNPHVTTTAQTHYGNPKHGCMKDEEVIKIEGGSVCAPIIARDSKTHAPACTFMDATPNAKNGCPGDTPDASRGSLGAFPSCTDAGSHASSSNRNTNAHCFLTCGSCREGDEAGDDCMAAADDSCPRGSTCKVGYHRHMNLGTCVYDN